MSRRKIILVIITAQVLVLFFGCGMLIEAGVNTGLDVVTAPILQDRLKVSGLTIEKAASEDENYGVIIIRGTLEYSPAKVLGGAKFLDLNRWNVRPVIEFKLTDDNGNKVGVASNGQIRLKKEGVTLDAFPANEQIPFEFEQRLPKAIWEATESAKGPLLGYWVLQL